MTNTLIFGLNDGATRWYPGSNPVAGEEAAAPNGFGQKVAVRHYENHPDDIFPSGGTEETRAKAGRLYLASCSPQVSDYTYPDILAGTLDTAFNNMFDRLLALGVEVWFCFRHEMDIHLDLGSSKAAAPGEFAQVHRHLYALFQARAAYAASGHNVKWVVIGTGWTAYAGGTLASFWPGDQYVDFNGIDLYNWGNLDKGLFNLATFQKRSLQYMLSDAYAWQQDHPLPIVVGEVAVVENPNDSSGSASGKQWWIDAGAHVAANLDKIAGVFAFQPPQNNSVASEVIAYATNPDKHAGVQAFITATGGNATSYSAGSRGSAPSAPTGLTVTSSAEGTSATGTWDAPPSGDSVTGWDAYLAAGANATSGFKKVNASTLPATPLSYAWTGLSSGAPYTMALVAINADGRSGYSNKPSLTTSIPGATNASPIIDNESASVDGFTITFTCTAHDPDDDSITCTWDITGPNGFTATATGLTPSLTVPSAGTYSGVPTVTDGTLPTTGSPVTAIVSDGSATDVYQIPLVEPENGIAAIRKLGPTLRSAMRRIDYLLSTMGSWVDPNGQDDSSNPSTGIFTQIAGKIGLRVRGSSSDDELPIFAVEDYAKAAIFWVTKAIGIYANDVLATGYASATQATAKKQHSWTIYPFWSHGDMWFSVGDGPPGNMAPWTVACHEAYGGDRSLQLAGWSDANGAGQSVPEVVELDQFTTVTGLRGAIHVKKIASTGNATPCTLGGVFGIPVKSGVAYRILVGVQAGPLAAARASAVFGSWYNSSGTFESSSSAGSLSLVSGASVPTLAGWQVAVSPAITAPADGFLQICLSSPLAADEEFWICGAGLWKNADFPAGNTNWYAPFVPAPAGAGLDGGARVGDRAYSRNQTDKKCTTAGLPHEQVWA